MKKSCVSVLLAIGFVQFSQVHSKAIVGYVNQVWPDNGFILINNPLSDGVNTLSSQLGGAPIGTTVEFWDPVANDYTTASVKGAAGWSINYDLYPSIGARVFSPVGYTNTYVGEVVFTPGSDPDHLLPPPEFMGPAGVYLLGCLMPLALMEGSPEGVFEYVLGRGPNVGEQFTSLDPATQVYTTTTYLGAGTWDNGTPSLDVAESAFFTTIPEPTTVTLLGLGSLALVMGRRRIDLRP